MVSCANKNKIKQQTKFLFLFAKIIICANLLTTIPLYLTIY